jgi:plasmid stabilization system protein ParE
MSKKYQAEVTKIAELDILQIRDHISRDNESAASKWVQEIRRQIDSLEKFPLRCPVIPESSELGKEYRHLIYGNYRTLFKVIGSRVLIMRVIHGARLLDI